MLLCVLILPLITGNNSEQQSSIKIQLDKIYKQGLHLSAESAKQFALLREELMQAMKNSLERSNENVETTCNEEAEQAKSLAEIYCGLSKLQSMAKSMSQENRILGRLYFEAMYAREDTIADAEDGTFEWILEGSDNDSVGENKSSICEDEDDQESSQGQEDEILIHGYSRDGPENVNALESRSDDAASFEYDLSPNDRSIPQTEGEMRQSTRHSFLNWLKSGNRVFHISGKAGSGKSTLMKLLSQHSRVRQKLDVWAARKKLVTAHFFFWNSGSKLQMSLEGLYRALLFETLKQIPELIPEVFPRQWEQLESEVPGFESALFRLPEIKTAFNILINRKKFPNHRICFFIDGLDEYEGDSVEHWKLAENLQNWTKSKDIKVCVSSRLHTEFLYTFSDDPRVRINLHKLTRDDINRFACAMFRKDKNFDRVQDKYLNLVKDIVDAAEGVFLWARLVVHSLLSGIGNRDSDLALQEKLNAIPKGLDELFDKLLGAIEPADRKRSDKMLLIATHESSRSILRTDPNINAIVYSWLEDLEDPKFPFSSPFGGYSDEEIEKRHEDLRRQLNSLSKGLVEINSVNKFKGPKDIYFRYTVQFFHRTVREYLQDNSRQTQMKSRLPGFDVVIDYSRLCLAEFKFASINYIGANLITPFEHGLGSLMDIVHRGRDVPSHFIEEIGRILHHHRQFSLSNSMATETNAGLVCCSGGELHAPEMDVVSFDDELSYLHCLAFYCQCRYVSQRVLQDPKLVTGDNKLSLLLAAAAGPAPDLVHFLLGAGARPSDQIMISDAKDSRVAKGLEKLTTVWMVFLAIFCSTVLTQGRGFLGSLCIPDLSSVSEQFLRSGANSEIFFLVHLNNDDGDPLNPNPCDEELFSMPLQQFLRLTDPPNLEPIQKVLLEREKRSLWSKAISSISTFFTPRSESSSAVVSKYKPFEFNELGEKKYTLHSVYSETDQLRNSFFVRIY